MQEGSDHRGRVTHKRKIMRLNWIRYPQSCVGYPRSCVSAIRGVEVPALQKMGVGGHMIFFTHLPVGLQFTFRSNHVTVSSESGVRGHMISFTPVGLHSLSGQTT